MIPASKVVYYLHLNGINVEHMQICPVHMCTKHRPFIFLLCFDCVEMIAKIVVFFHKQVVCIMSLAFYFI